MLQFAVSIKNPTDPLYSLSTATKYNVAKKGKSIHTSNLKYFTFLSGSDFPAIPTDSTTSMFFL